MKTITRTITLYTAAELKALHPKTFDKAREKYNDTTDYEWWGSTYDDFLAIAALMGFNLERKKIIFSGFSCQGDGASFTGSVQFAPNALEKVKEYAPQDEELHRIAADCSRYGAADIRVILSRTSHHYSHENTVMIDRCWRDASGHSDDWSDELPEDITTREVLETCRSLMRWLYKSLEREYVYRSGEECFLETAEVNEWTFTAEGELDNE